MASKQDARRFDLMVQLRTIAGDIEERFGPGDAVDLAVRLERTTNDVDEFIRSLLFGEESGS